MLQRTIVGALVMIALTGPASTAQSQVNVHIGINLPAPPPLVAIPASPVMYAPTVGANYFFYGGQYYVLADRAWYVSRGFSGPWVVVAPDFVPRPILAVPVRYYHAPPAGWRYARRQGPPERASHWGRGWQEERGEGHHGGPRG
jgi:hypothetical protein